MSFWCDADVWISCGAVLVAFDLDGTIIKPKGSAKWPRDENDWEFWNGRVAAKLRRAHSDGSVPALYPLL